MTTRSLALGVMESIEATTGYAPTGRKSHTLAWIGSYALALACLIGVLAMVAK